MNAPYIDRSILLRHIREIEAAYNLSVLGLIPYDDDDVSFPEGEERAMTLLAEKTADISLLDLVRAQLDLGDRLGRRVIIVPRSGLQGREAEELPARVQPL